MENNETSEKKEKKEKAFDGGEAPKTEKTDKKDKKGKKKRMNGEKKSVLFNLSPFFLHNCAKIVRNSLKMKHGNDIIMPDWPRGG